MCRFEAHLGGIVTMAFVAATNPVPPHSFSNSLPRQLTLALPQSAHQLALSVAFPDVGFVPFLLHSIAASACRSLACLDENV